MALETPDDFDQAFKEFSTPEAKASDAKPADAAPAADDAAPAAQGGDNIGGDTAAAVVDDGSGGADTGAAADGAVADKAADPAPKGKKKGAEPAPAADAGAVADAGADTTAADAAPVKAEKPAVDTNADDILNRLAKIVSDTKQEDKPAPVADTATEAIPELYTPEETEFLTGYDKDWADVARGESLKRKAEYRDMLQYIFTEVGKFVAPLRETTNLLAERTHLADIKSNVVDYSDALRDQVVDWAGKQPPYLQAAYNHVIEQGSADEVKDLVDRYRKETGQVVTGAAPDPAGKDNELSGEAKQAAEAMAPVESKRSGVQQPSDPSNFDDAWAQFAKP